MSLRRIDGGTVQIGDLALPVEVRVNPRARRLILRLGRERKVTVTCPSKRHVTQALRMVESQRHWLSDQLADTPTPIPLAVGQTLPVLGQDRKVVRAEKLTAAATLCPETITVGGRDAEATHRRLESMLRAEVRTAITREAIEFADQIGKSFTRITVREMTSRWGSCAYDGALSFNWRLVFAPRGILTYVVAHEIAHLEEMNHSPAFWQIVESLYPDYREAARWLADEGSRLHAFGQHPH